MAAVLLLNTRWACVKCQRAAWRPRERLQAAAAEVAARTYRTRLPLPLLLLLPAWCCSCPNLLLLVPCDGMLHLAMLDEACRGPACRWGALLEQPRQPVKLCCHSRLADVVARG
jgi:hypothetical protein